eukprot:gene24952-32512_t
MTSTRSKAFNVLFTSDVNKKRKVYHDGTLNFKQHAPVDPNITATLFALDKVVLRRTTEKAKLFNDVSVGDEISIGQYSVQIESILEGDHEDDSNENSSNVSNVIKKDQFIKSDSSKPASYRSFRHPNLAAHDSKKPATGTSQTFVKTDVTLGGIINMGKFKVPTSTNEHQADAHITANSSSLAVELDSSLSNRMRQHQIDGAMFMLNKLTEDNAESRSTSNVKGAILADEMGLGKTLISISVIWAFVRSGTCKSLIVCPSSLCKNWQKEFLKFLGTKCRPLCVQSGDGADTVKSIINTFSCGHMKGIAPALILSYEMFRKYAVLLNTVRELNLLVCDEGHRLKKAEGSQTFRALCGCRAKMRIVLTGTPIQNNLEELYTLVSFVAPGYLGPIGEFNANFAIPIQRGCEPGASSSDREHGAIVSTRLRETMSRVLLRRTQREVLTHLLPPRTDFVIYCRMTATQSERYNSIADQIRRMIGEGGRDLDDDEAVESSEAASSAGTMLSMLSSLRLACNNTSGNTSSMIVSSSSISSVKLQVLEKFVSILRMRHPAEKLVIVSSFTSTLDLVESLASRAGWGSAFRLDGQVPVQKRQPMVDQFNSPTDKTFLFLLSCKAGGVGINLIGASRLVMFDVDWNPANDKQAMSRIWRDGQKRPVFIYRLICHGTIEDAIFQRQNSKSDLAMALEGCDGDEPPQERDDESSSAGRSDVKMSVRRQSLTKRDVLLLLDPTASRLENSKKGSIDKKSVGWRSSSVVDSDEEGSQLEEEQDCADAEEGGEAVACAMKISAQDIPSSCAPVDDVVAQTVQ